VAFSLYLTWPPRPSLPISGNYELAQAFDMPETHRYRRGTQCFKSASQQTTLDSDRSKAKVSTMDLHTAPHGPGQCLHSPLIHLLLKHLTISP
jgi:hypothetical protein